MAWVVVGRCLGLSMISVIMLIASSLMKSTLNMADALWGHRMWLPSLVPVRDLGPGLVVSPRGLLLSTVPPKLCSVPLRLRLRSGSPPALNIRTMIMSMTI